MQYKRGASEGGGSGCDCAGEWLGTPPSSGKGGKGRGDRGGKESDDGVEGCEGDGGGLAKEGIAFVLTLRVPGKYRSSKSARSQILVVLVVGL